MHNSQIRLDTATMEDFLLSRNNVLLENSTFSIILEDTGIQKFQMRFCKKKYFQLGKPPTYFYIFKTFYFRGNIWHVWMLNKITSTVYTYSVQRAWFQECKSLETILNTVPLLHLEPNPVLWADKKLMSDLIFKNT